MPPTDLVKPHADELIVSEIFGPTFQGEGYSLGRRAIFVRLGICNLKCTWCDTKYTWDWKNYDYKKELKRIPIDEVRSQVDELWSEGTIIVITGGEPLLQQEKIVDLINPWTDRIVEIETAGTVMPSLSLRLERPRFNISPKLDNSGNSRISRERPDVLSYFARSYPDPGGPFSVFKFVVETVDDLPEVDFLVVRYNIKPSDVYIMPEGTHRFTIIRRQRQLADEVIKRGYNMTTRLHVLTWGNDRGR